MNGANRYDFIEPKLSKLRNSGLRLNVIDLVDSNQHRLATPPQPPRSFQIERYNAFLNVDDKDDKTRGFNCNLNLHQRGFGDAVRSLFAWKQADTARIQNRKRMAAPLGFGADPVPSDPRLIVNDGYPTPHNAVEQCRFANV